MYFLQKLVNGKWESFDSDIDLKPICERAVAFRDAETGGWPAVRVIDNERGNWNPAKPRVDERGRKVGIGDYDDGPGVVLSMQRIAKPRSQEKRRGQRGASRRAARSNRPPSTR